MVKNLPGMQETRVRSLDQEDPLEKVMATHSSILAWRIPGTEEPLGHGGNKIYCNFSVPANTQLEGNSVPFLTGASKLYKLSPRIPYSATSYLGNGEEIASLQSLLNS